MDDGRYKLLMRLAVLLSVAWFGWTLYEADLGDAAPDARHLAAGLRYLEDERYEDALGAFSEALAIDSENLGALRGKAQSLMQLGARHGYEADRLAREGQATAAERSAAAAQQDYGAALDAYDEAISREQARGLSEQNRRILGVAYANRGILKDRMADYSGALSDYRAAMQLEPAVQEGPGLVTRFLRNQAQKPPTVADRARYLEGQLAKPESERVLQQPPADSMQRPYRLD